MKIKPIIPFKFLEKYKYIYFAINSLILAFLVVLFIELTDNDSIFILKNLLFKMFFYWGFLYPVSFVIYEVARKQNKKEQRQ